MPVGVRAARRAAAHANGKVDRSALPAPEAARGGRAAWRPGHPTEEQVAQLFGRGAGRRARSGRDDSFFELGGHSLLATQVVARAARRAAGRAAAAGALRGARRCATSPAGSTQAGAGGAAGRCARSARRVADGGAPAVVRAGAALVSRPARPGQRRVHHAARPSGSGARSTSRALERALDDLCRAARGAAHHVSCRAGGEPRQVIDPPGRS